MIHKVGVFPNLFYSLFIPCSRWSASPESNLESWNLGSDFQSSSTSLNQTHMSVGVLFRAEKHLKQREILYFTAQYWNPWFELERQASVCECCLL